MKNKLGQIFVILGCVLMLSFVCMAPEKVAFAQGDLGAFDIQKYHVYVSVTKGNIYHITEEVSVHFYASRHGIFRDIPLINRLGRGDGSSDVVRPRVTHVSCSENFTESVTSNNGTRCRRLTIGDKDKLVDGDHEYRISYDYEMGDDVLEGEDELYFNVIGTQWGTEISNVSFEIDFPEDVTIAQGKVGAIYGSGSYQSTDGLKLFLPEKNRLEGTLDPGVKLSPGMGLTVRVLLPEGYFEPERSVDWEAVAEGGFILLAVAVAGIMWWIVGRDKDVVNIVSFHPPAGLNSLEVALAYHGEVSDKDVISLVVYLAQKGYIDIDASDEKNFVLSKLKEYDGTNVIERQFMDELFQGSIVVSEKTLVNKFYKSINKIRGIINDKNHKSVIFHRDSINKDWILWGLIVFVWFLGTRRICGEYFGDGPMSLIASIGVGALALVLSYMALHRSKGVKAAAILGVVLFLRLGMFRVFGILAESETEQIVLFVLMLLATIGIDFFWYFMPRRNAYGRRMLGEIGGFKEFLKVAEKDKLEQLVEENPEYFYDILPYAYVLDVSDAWMDKFESIAIEPPRWYGGYGHFYVHSFHDSLDHTLNDMKYAMTSSPSGSGGGGGSAGGGAGGGGGGSW